MRVPMEKLFDFGVAFLSKRGVPEESARYISQIVVESEAFRQSTHGLIQFVVLNKALGKEIDPAAEPDIERRFGAMAVVDGQNALGLLAMKLAKEIAVDAAKTHGVGFVSVRNSRWLGAVGMHLISLAQAGFFCQTWVQMNTCKDCAPAGGIDARFSTNPMALAFPTAGDPVVADFSTSTMSMGLAGELIKSGKKTETPRFLDSEGNATNDPSVMNHNGTLMFMGGEADGHKGYALSLFVEALTVLAGGGANDPSAPQRQCFSLLVLDPAAFGTADHYAREMERFLNHVKSSRPRPGAGTIRLPGARGFAALADCRANGVPLDEEKIHWLRGLAVDNGIPPIV